MVVVSVGAGEVLTRVGFLGQIVKFVGAGVVWMWGGDACVALGGGGRRSHDQDEGDAQHKASPPTASAAPAPTGSKPLLK
jgi:hypothetical protein